MNKFIIHSLLLLAINNPAYGTIQTLKTYFNQLKNGIGCFAQKKECTSEEKKVVRQTIERLLKAVAFVAVAGTGTYIMTKYVNAKWHQDIDKVLPLLSEKFNFNFNEKDQDVNYGLTDETGKIRSPTDSWQDKEMIMLAAEGNEKAFTKIRALNRPEAIKAALFIASKRGHHSFVQKFKQNLNKEHFWVKPN